MHFFKAYLPFIIVVNCLPFVLIAQPAISSFSPINGSIGNAIVINGVNFSPTLSNNIVFFGATKANVFAASSTSLSVGVPVGATYGPITVLNITTGLAGSSLMNFNPTFTPSKTAIAGGDLKPKIDFGTANGTASIATGDLDGDGRTDAIAINYNSNSVSVFRNTAVPGTISSASFAARQDFTTGIQPILVAVGDMDGDSRLDIVAANLSDNTVSVLRNTTSGGVLSFAGKVDFATGASPRSVAIGDINGDGRPDLVVANAGSNTLSILRNTSSTGTINFAEKLDYTAGVNAYSVAIGDIDGDGRRDIAVNNYNDNTVSVFRNTSTGGAISFAAKIDYTTGTNPQAVAFGDIDGDAKPDMVIANVTSNNMSIFRNTSVSGSVNFAARVDYTTGTQPTMVAFGDFDADSKPDIALSNYGSNTLSVFRNISAGGVIGLSAKIDFTTGNSPQSITIGDIDGDKKPDVLTANWSSNNISVLRSTNNDATLISLTSNAGIISPAFSTNTTDYSLNVISATNSIRVTSQTNDNNSSIQIRINGGTYAIVASGSPSSPLPLNAGVNTIEVLVTAEDGATTRTYTIVVTRGIPGISSFSPMKAKPGDAVTITGTNFNTTPANNIVFFGAVRAGVTAASPTSLTVTVPIGATYGPVSVLNTDGNLSCASLNSFNPTYRPAKSNITGSDFIGKTDFTTGTNPYAIAIGDLDGDGKPDLVVANLGSNNVSVYRNTAAGGSIGNGSFAAKVDLATGNSPYSIAIGDLDGDGKSDLAITNINSSTVSVFRNTSTSGSITSGSFANRVDFGTGLGPISVAIVDVDGDGKPDLAVANTGSNTVSVLRNTSTSGSITANSFLTRVDFPTGNTPYAVGVGDLDGDGKPDLAVPNYNANTVSILRSTAVTGRITASSFAAKVDFTTGSTPNSVAIGDYDGDGKPDLAIANYNSNSVSVLRNTSSIGSIGISSFADKIDFTTGLRPLSVTIGDLDGNGKPDMAVANIFSNSVSIFRNTASSGSIGTGSFAAKVDFETGSLPVAVAIGDLNGDGKPDLVSTNTDANTLSVLPNADIPIPAITSFSPISARPGDTVILTGRGFNSSVSNNIVFFGATRATVTAATANNVTVTVPAGATYAPISLLNTDVAWSCYSLTNFTPTYSPPKTKITKSDFSPRQNFSTGNNPHAIAISDLDGDGKPDLVVANAGSNTISVYRNTSTGGTIGTGSFAARVDFATGISPESIAIGDLDGDGKPDLAVTNFNSNSVSVFRNTGSAGSFTSGSFATRVDFSTGDNSYPYSVAIADLDSDGKLDLAVTNIYSNIISLFRNTAVSGSITTGSFAAKVDFGTGNRPTSVAIGDLDGDGKPDLAVTNSGNSISDVFSVSVFRNTSVFGSIASNSFAARVDFGTPNFPRTVAIGDLDGDGKPDLAVAGTGVSIFRNTASNGNITSSSFDPRVDFATFPGPYSIAIGDLDGDGKPDLAIACITFFENAISVFRNTANTGSITTGSFDARVDFAGSGGPYSIAIGDLDGDGNPEMATANSSINQAGGANTFSVYRNNIVYTFTGSGNWDNAANWSGSVIPPSTVPANVQILINPAGAGECILNVPVTVPASSSITVATGKRFMIQGNLTISNQ